MVLTRHLYSLDEVHAALVYASQRSDCSETVFWCRELIDSGYAAEAISTLFSAWMWHRGPFDLQWLVRAATTLASDAVTEEDILVSAHHLSQRCMRDHSLWTILTSTVPDRVTPRTPPFCVARDPKELFFFRAVYQGKAQSAWWMARHMESSRVWELLSEYVGSSAYAESYRVCFQVLQHYESLLGYRSEDSNILCLAVLSACLSPAQQEKSFRVLLEPAASVVAAPPEETIRRDRRYSIPTACLYGDTARGRMTWSQSTLRSLRELDLEGPFWDEYKWTTEEEREAFYDRFFPDDPPDEWTLAEQQRSHGDGVLSDIGCTMEKYARLFLSHTSRLAWSIENKTPLMGPYPGTMWVSVPPLQEVDEAFLVPVVRRLRVLRV